MQERLVKYKVPESLSDCASISKCAECDVMRDEFSRLHKCHNLQRLRYEILSLQSGNTKRIQTVTKDAKVFSLTRTKRQAS